MNLEVHPIAIIIFTILLALPGEILSGKCFDPIDEQCMRGCYYNIGNCYECANCTRNQLVDIAFYHRAECTSFPALCKRQTTRIDWREYATDFHPINLPPLKGSFIGYHHQWLLSFFQEETHPTVGKLCMNEAQKVPTEWFTFEKSVLNCTGHEGVLYNYLLAVKNHSYNTSLYLTLMSSLSDNKNQSALCLFTYTEIEKVFNLSTRKFYDPTVEEEWTAFPDEHIPQGEYPLGLCYAGIRWTDVQKSFIRSHPMMYYNVTASQVLAEGDGVFTALESVEKRGRDGTKHIIVFVGTGDGRILKYILIGLDEAPNFVEEIYLTKNSSIGITNLEVVWEPLQLKILTSDDEEPLYEPLHRCSSMTNQCVCEQDPYCTWNVDGVSCRSFDWGRGREPDQPPITKKTCEGILPGSALLITNKHGRPIQSDITTVDTETTGQRDGQEDNSGLPEGPSPGMKTSNTGSNTVSEYLLIVCVCVLVIVFLIALFVWHTVYCRNNKTHQNFAFDSRDWKSDWTSIIFNQKHPYMKLRDASEGETEYEGEIVNGKTVFENLKPLTDFQVCCPGESSPFIVSTKGPTFTDWVESVNTVEVKTDGVDAPFNSCLVLKSEGRDAQRKSIVSSLVKFSGLTPNMNFAAWLEVSKSKSDGVIEKCIKDVRTSEESFNVGEVNGKPCLMWSNLSTSIKRFVRTCSCGTFEGLLTDENGPISGSKELPLLPQSAKFCFKVMTALDSKGGEHVLASVQYESPDIDLVKLPEDNTVGELSEDRSGAKVTTDGDALDSDDSSSRVHSLPVPADLNLGSSDDSSSRIRSEPTLKDPASLVSAYKDALVSRQMSVGNETPTLINANNSTVYLNCNFNGSTASSSSGVGSLPSSQSSFIDLPFKGYGIQIGEECHRCSATFSSLINLKNEERHQLALKIFLSRQTVIFLCELLQYSKDQVAYFVEHIRSPEKALQPIEDKEYESEQISVATLLYKLMKVFPTMSQCDHANTKEQDLWSEMHFLYNVVEFMATVVHKDCPACKPIHDSVRHTWICHGYEKRCYELNPHLFSEKTC